MEACTSKEGGDGGIDTARIHPTVVNKAVANNKNEEDDDDEIDLDALNILASESEAESDLSDLDFSADLEADFARLAAGGKEGIVVPNPAFTPDDGGQGDNDDNGQEEVDVMIGKIEVQKREFDDLNAVIKANGGTPPPDSGLAAVAAEEGCNALGSLFNIEKSLQQQLKELVVRGGAAGATAFAADLDAVRKDLAGTHTTLQTAVDSFLKEWKLNLPDSCPPSKQIQRRLQSCPLPTNLARSRCSA